MIPPNEWPIGCKFVSVTTVSHKTPQGVPDPHIVDRFCLPHEAQGLVASIMGKNPYATAYVSQEKTWRGVPQ